METANRKTNFLGVYVSSATAADPTRPNSPHYQRAYNGLFSELFSLGCSPVLVYDQEINYLGNGRFKEYWAVNQNKNKIEFVRHNQEIQLDFIFDKARFDADDVATTASAEVREICRDKYASYLFAPELHALSFLIDSQEQLEVFFKSHKNQPIVLKELDSNGGEKVFIGQDIDYKNDLEFPIIAQEFLDTSVGIKDICEGYHDLRTTVYNGEIIGLLLRQPPKGGFMANRRLGGVFEDLDLKLMPKELPKIVQILDQRFATKKDRFYSIDFCNTADGWKVFELNAWPGLDYDSENEKLRVRRLAKCLVSSLDTAIIKTRERA
jgi:glutathione synthase/RimK-type ligase-like ATP-grasp enzyme